MDTEDSYAPDMYNDTTTLSYDDTTSYEDQQLAAAEASRALASRIGRAKVYLLSEVRTAGGKRKRDEATTEDTEDVDMDEDSIYRPNALLLHGTPIGSLPTARIFAYATHFEAQPMALEWIDDNTCVLVFASKKIAEDAHRCIRKTEDEDDDGYVNAKPVPVTVWPPEERINITLGKAEALKGTLRMRWAKHDDLKKKGAKKESQFYRKHGEGAGKDPRGMKTQQDRDRDVKRRRREAGNGDIVDEAAERAKLDDDLDRFLAADSDQEDVDPEPEEPLIDLPPSKMRSDYIPSDSKMRSDYISPDGRTLLERTSEIRLRPDTLASRITAPLPRRQSDRAVVWESSKANLEWGRVRETQRRSGRHRGRERSTRTDESRRRPPKSHQELDDELDAFLNEQE